MRRRAARVAAARPQTLTLTLSLTLTLTLTLSLTLTLTLTRRGHRRSRRGCWAARVTWGTRWRRENLTLSQA